MREVTMKNATSGMKRFVTGLIAAACVMPVGTAFAGGGGAFYWQGDDPGSPTDWGTFDNWDMSLVPGPVDDCYFYGTASSFTVDLNGSRECQGIIFSGTNS